MNTIEKAIKYIKEPDALYKSLVLGLRTRDLENGENVFVGTDTVKYQRIEFPDKTLGTYDKTKGYSKKGFNLTWNTIKLTQDVGDSLFIDKMDDEESCANGIVRIANRYIDTVQAPAVDKYRTTKIAFAPNAFVKCAELTADNIYQSIRHAKTRLADAGIDTGALLMYIRPTANELLSVAAVNKGWITLGNWNGDMSAEVRMVAETIKIVEMPADRMPSGVQFMVFNPSAVPAFVKYSESEFFEKIPGHGGRKMQADIGLYHDSFVYDELNDAVYIHKNAADTTYTVTYASGNGSATGTAPTQAATAPDNTFILKGNAFTLTGKKFVGWHDGYRYYKAGDEYIMRGRNVTFTAVWADA